jgi:hypothetical protein
VYILTGNDFKIIETKTSIKDSSITLKDIKSAETKFEQDIGMLKGKTVRMKQLPVASDHIEIPKEIINNHHEVKFSIGIMKINGLSFLTTISRMIYRNMEYLQNNNVQAD